MCLNGYYNMTDISEYTPVINDFSQNTHNKEEHKSNFVVRMLIVFN